MDHNEEINCEATYKRRRVGVVPISCPLSKRYSGLYLIERDLASIEILIGESQKKGCISHVAKGLFVAITTIYWKCFADTRGRNRVVLNKKKYIKDESLMMVHEKIKDVRHNFSAHSGDITFEKAKVFVLKGENGKPASTVVPVVFQANNADAEFLEDIRNLVSHIKNNVSAEMSSIIETLKDKYC